MEEPYLSSGPFVNSQGQAVAGLDMKCVCKGLSVGKKPGDVEYFLPSIYSHRDNAPAVKL
jgi:hypothetical protein